MDTQKRLGLPLTHPVTQLSHAKLASLCSRAYEDLTGTTRELEFLITRHDGVSYVAIRGTETSTALTGYGWVDILRNMRVLPRHNVSTSFGHGGFVAGAESVAESLIQFAALGNRIVLTGHSLGAAIAVLSSQILAKAGYEIIEVVLFGCPRVYFVKRPNFDYPVTSYRHGSDIVCNIPRWYRQPVELKELNPNNRFPNWSDHRIEKYEAALRGRRGEERA